MAMQNFMMMLYLMINMGDPASIELNNLSRQYYPGNLDNYRLNIPDVFSLQEKGHYGYMPGQPLTGELQSILGKDYGKYTSSRYMTSGMIDNITKGRINQNVNVDNLSKEQTDNAKIIASVVIDECKKQGKSPQETKKAVVIALATALQETSLKNLAYGMDGDNAGLFQQRANCGWGNREERMDPVHATRRFTEELLKTNYKDHCITKLW
jgi:hypothetical protein